jgi:phage shock protein A
MATIKEIEVTVKNLEEALAKMGKALTDMEAKLETLTRRRGPSSTREMTLEDAERVINGDLKGLSHKSAAEKLGLSYGQVYSARGGYTFKGIKRQ